MRRRLPLQTLIGAMAIALAVLAQPTARGQTGWDVKAGYDLFETVAADTMFGTPPTGLGNLMGVPLGTFNFGSGTVNTGLTDTIVQRNADVNVAATAGSTGSTSLTMRALQLETVTPVNFMSFGLNNYFVTLNPTTASTGTLNLTFNSNAGGTFTSNLDVFFDIRAGSLTGPVVVADQELILTSTAEPWGRIPPAGAETITGVNQFLQGDGTMNGDFWPGAEIHQGPHGVIPAQTPEPSTWVMGTIAAVAGLTYTGWRRRAAGA